MSEPVRTLTPQARPGSDLRRRVEKVGDDLARSFGTLLAMFPGAPLGPQRLAELLGESVVTTSRLLKALRTHDPVAVVHYMPGPDPLRRLTGGAKRQRIRGEALTRTEEAIDRFEELIRTEVGDRSALGAILADWVPELRTEFEVRRRQAVFKAMSELRGTSCATVLSSMILHPSRDGKRMDIVAVDGMFGVRRLRPAGELRFQTKRIGGSKSPRHPTNLAGEPVEGVGDTRLDQFCVAPAAPMRVLHHGDDLHYVLGESGFGPDSAVDIVQAEVNRDELPLPKDRPPEEHSFVFHTTSVPTKSLVLDLHFHKSICPEGSPDLIVYDTSVEGPARAHDPVRDFDRMDVTDTVKELGVRMTQKRIAEIPTYVDLMQHVLDRLAWKAQDFRTFRVRADFPLFGSQYTLVLPRE